MAGIAKALLIGNSDYSDPNIKPLLAPKNDIMRLAAALQREDIAGFETDPVFDVDLPTAQKKISAFYKNADEDDLLLFYFAGHGIRDGGRNLYLALPETDLEYVEATGLSARFLLDSIKNSASNKKVVILDCCHAGAVFKDEDGELQSKDAPYDPGYIGEQLIGTVKSNTKGSGAHILAACGASQSAFEKTFTVGGKKKSASLYTKLLTEGIETGKAAPDSENIMVSDIHRYVSEKRAKKGGVVTEPVKAEPEGADGLILCKNPNVRRPLSRIVVDDLHSSNIRLRRGAIKDLTDIAMGSDKYLTKEVLALFQSRLDRSKSEFERDVQVREDLETGAEKIQEHIESLKPSQRQSSKRLLTKKKQQKRSHNPLNEKQEPPLKLYHNKISFWANRSILILVALWLIFNFIVVIGAPFVMFEELAVYDQISNKIIGLQSGVVGFFTMLGCIAILLNKRWPAWFFLVGVFIQIAFFYSINVYEISPVVPLVGSSIAIVFIEIAINIWFWWLLRKMNKAQNP